MRSKCPKFNVSWVSGMPRSGTTWLSQIIASSPDVRLKSCPLFSYEFKNALNKESTKEQWEQLFVDVYNTESEFLDQEHLRKHGLVPTYEYKVASPGNLVIKSNRFHNLTPYILSLNEDVRFVYIVRNPCAAIYSWMSDPQEFPENANPLNEWRTGHCRKTGPGEFWGFDDWKLVTLQSISLSEQYPKRFKIIRYEELVKNPVEITEAIFQFLHIPFGAETLNFIKMSHSKHDAHKHSIYKNPKLLNKWENMLDKTIVELCMKDIEASDLERFAAS